MNTRVAPGRGFTLLEMMLVVVIMGVLATVAVVALSGRGKAAKIGATKMSLKTIDGMIENYHLDYSSYPPTLEALAPKYLKKVAKDAWKNDFVYAPNSADGKPYMLYSKGDDGQVGGGDDLNIWTIDEDTGGV